MKHSITDKNQEVTDIVKSVLTATNSTYHKLYREKRTSNHAANIDGKSIRFFAVRASNVDKVISEVNARLPENYRAEAYAAGHYMRLTTIQVFNRG